MSDRSDISAAKVLASFATIFLFSVHTNYAGEFDIVVKDRAIVQRCVTDKDARHIAVGMPGGFSYSFDPGQVTIELNFPGNDSSPRYYHMNGEDVELSERLQLNNSGAIKIPPTETWVQIPLKLKPGNEKFVRKEPTTNGRLLYALHCMSCHTLDGRKKSVQASPTCGLESEQ